MSNYKKRTPKSFRNSWGFFDQGFLKSSGNRHCEESFDDEAIPLPEREGLRQAAIASPPKASARNDIPICFVRMDDFTKALSL